MKHFLYVKGKKSSNTLLSLGFNLLKSDEKNQIYVFENKAGTNFSFGDIEAVESDTLTF